MSRLGWHNVLNFEGHNYTCGHCGREVGSDKGYHSTQGDHFLRICPSCTHPSYFAGVAQFPGVPHGEFVKSLPKEVEILYEEARRCISASAYTPSVMASRKLLMNIAVYKGAKAGDTFAAYVDFLSTHHFIPPGGEVWAKIIKDKGNEANHEIKPRERADAEQLIDFLEMLLKFIFEFPAKAGAIP